MTDSAKFLVPLEQEAKEYNFVAEAAIAFLAFSHIEAQIV